MVAWGQLMVRQRACQQYEPGQGSTASSRLQQQKALDRIEHYAMQVLEADLASSKARRRPNTTLSSLPALEFASKHIG